MRSFATRLVAWQKHHGRHDLPWQRTRDAYAIWLSEIMLQQTQVATVIPYYETFLRRFPTVRALAKAPLDDVLALWSGLGYYSRARNLHEAARIVVNAHGATFPADPAVLETLPGIGRSTAAAISVFAYGERHAILDGNVKRVLARHGGIAGYPGEARVQEQLWREAQALLPAREVVAYTQGLMDMGAGVCTRTKPRCEECPVREDCVARAKNITDVLPTRKPQRALPERATVMLLLRYADDIFLERRPPRGIWGGLWSLPEVAHERDARRICRRLGVEVIDVTPLPKVEHGFTHFKLTIQPLLIGVRKPCAPTPAKVGASQTKWTTISGIASTGLPAPVRKILLSTGI